MTAVDKIPPGLGGFRHALRNGSRAEHDRVETVFAPFQSDPVGRMDWFLAAQRSGLGALSMARVGDEGRACEVILEDLIERLDFDLATRGVMPVPVVSDRPLRALAVDYLVLGSRLGTEVQRRMLSDRLGPQDMPTYFMAPPATALWKRHCAHLAAIDPQSLDAPALCADVAHGFALFARAADVQSNPQDATAGRDGAVPPKETP